MKKLTVLGFVTLLVAIYAAVPLLLVLAARHFYLERDALLAVISAACAGAAIVFGLMMGLTLLRSKPDRRD